MTTDGAPRPPKGLSQAVREWWEEIVRRWELDQAALAILNTAAEAAETEARAIADLRRRGQIVGGKVNPSVGIASTAALVKLKAIRALNLDLEPLQNRPGRPSGPVSEATKQRWRETVDADEA